jgi:2'-5' RNA ligase
MRLFVGIPLADGVVRELAAVAARLRTRESGLGSGGELRWTAPESWHITLQFLGNATVEQLQYLAARLGEVRSAPVSVQLGELGCFDRAGVLFADVAVTPDLTALERRVAAATSQCGFVAETRPFHPHITLARAKGQGREDDLRELRAKIRSQPAFTRFTAREFVLYESHLGPGGARYEAKARFGLTVDREQGTVNREQGTGNDGIAAR